MLKHILKKLLVFLISQFYWKNNFSLEQFFSDELFFQNKIKKFNYFLFYHKRLYKLIIYPIIEEYKKVHNSSINDNELIVSFINKSHPELDERTILCILRLLYELGIEPYLVFTKALEIAQSTEDIFIKYWLIQNIETFAFWETIELPSDYYIRRKKLISDFCNSLSIISPTITKHVRNNSNKKQICIVTYLMGKSLQNSVQRILNMLTNNIDSEYFDISIVCLDSFYCKKDNIINITGWKNSFNFRKKSKLLLNKNTKVYYSKVSNIKSKIESSLKIIFNINPDLIIDISDEYSISSFYYSKIFQTLYIPLRGRITSTYCTIYKTSDYKETVKQNSYFQNVLADTKIIEWSFPEYIMASDVKYTRNQFGLTNKSFILVSAGILPPNDISFYKTMINILKSNSNYIWIIIGSTIPDFFIKENSNLFTSKRIIDWGFEKNLDSLYKICNVFINPNKTGGSGTIAIAAQQHLPIVLTKYPCDAMRWIKEENCLAGYEQYEKEIFNLYNDKNYYNFKSNLFYNLVSDACDSKKKWNDFNQILKETIQ